MRLDFRNKGNGKPWGGLGKCPQFEKSLICDSPAGNYWWMCIGCQGWYPVSLNQTIPGPSNILVKRVQLYAEKVNIEVESCNTNNSIGAIFIFSLFYLSIINYIIFRSDLRTVCCYCCPHSLTRNCALQNKGHKYKVNN